MSFGILLRRPHDVTLYEKPRKARRARGKEWGG